MFLPSYRETQDKWNATADDFSGYNNRQGFFVVSRWKFDDEFAKDCWKFHVSVNKSDLEKAWDALAINEEFVNSIDILKIISVEEIESSLASLNEEFQLLLEYKELFEGIKTNIESSYLVEGIKLLYLLHDHFQVHDPFTKEAPLSEKLVSLKVATAFLPIVSDMGRWGSVSPRDFMTEKNDIHLINLEHEINIIYTQMVEKYSNIIYKIAGAYNASDEETLTEENLPNFLYSLEMTNLMKLTEKFYAKIEEKFQYGISLEQRLYEGAQITIYVPNNSDYESYKKIIPLVNKILNEAKVSPGIRPASDLQLNPFVSVRHESSDRLAKYDLNSDVNRENPFKNCTDITGAAKNVMSFFPQVSSSENEIEERQENDNLVDVSTEGYSSN